MSKSTRQRKIEASKCGSCKYGYMHMNFGPYCDYILLTGHRRPCPPGEECTAYEKGQHPDGGFGAVPLELINPRERGSS